MQWDVNVGKKIGYVANVHLLPNLILYIFQESDNSNNEAVEKPFWEKLAEETGISFPDTLRNILTAVSFDHRAALLCFKDQDVQKHYTSIESFMRSKLILLLEKAEVPAYFGIYKNRPDLYEIPDGKILLSSQYFSFYFSLF